MNTPYQITCRPLSRFGIGLAIALGLGYSIGVQAGDSQTIILMLKRDVGQTTASPWDPAVEARLEQRSGVTLTWTGQTRTNAQILSLPANLSLDDARQVAARLSVADGVLWAEVKAPVSVTRSTQAPSGQARQRLISQFVIKLRRSGKPSAETVTQLSKTAGVPLTLQSPTAAGGWIYQLARPVTDRDSAPIESNLEALPEVMYADPVTA